MSLRFNHQHRKARPEALYRTLQSHHTEATRLMRSLGGPDNPRLVDERAARIVGVLQSQGQEIDSDNLSHVARLMNVPKLLQAPGTARSRAQALRELAAAHADWRPRRPQAAGSTAASQPPAGASAEWVDALPALAGTPLVHDGQLTAEAITQLTAAREALAREVGQPVDAIARSTAALRVLSDHWTDRVGRDPAAFDRARAAQDALTRAMGPLRSEQRSLAQTNSDYQATLGAIRALQPTFDEAQIAATQVGAAALSQLQPNMAPETFASLRLGIARQYLAHYEAQARAQAQVPAKAPTKTPAEAFIAKLKVGVRKDWEMRLIGGPTLGDVVTAESARGGALTVERIERAVQAVQPSPLLTDIADAQVGAWETIDTSKFYELRFTGVPDLRTKLKTALRYSYDEPMQIRKPDGSRRLDIYRHGNERGGTTIIDHRDGSALPQPAGSVAAILNALGIKANSYGGLVISYGSSEIVMAERPALYPDPSKVMQERAREQAMPLQRRLAQIDGDYNAMVRKLDTAVLVDYWENTQRSLPVYMWDERAALKNTVLRLESDWPQAIGKRAEMPAAIKLLNDYQMMGWFREVEESAAGERRADPLPGQSVTERRLAMIRELISRTPDLPENMKGPLGEAKLLVATLIKIGRLRKDRTMVTDGTLTEAQSSQMLASPRKYFDFLLQNPAAWRRVVEDGQKVRTASE